MAITKVMHYFVPKKMLTPEEFAAWDPNVVDEISGNDPFGLWVNAGELTGNTMAEISETARGDGTIPARATRVRYYEPFEPA